MHVCTYELCHMVFSIIIFLFWRVKFSFINRLVLRTNVLDKVATDPLKRWIHRVGKYRVISSLFPFFIPYWWNSWFFLVLCMYIHACYYVHRCRTVDKFGACYTPNVAFFSMSCFFGLKILAVSMVLCLLFGQVYWSL